MKVGGGGSKFDAYTGARQTCIRGKMIIYFTNSKKFIMAK